MSEATLYTREEVSKRNGKNGESVWIIINRDVYDVTNYRLEHPGGPELIEEYAGKESTSAFLDAGHSSDAKKQLKKLKIGELDPNDKNEMEKLPNKIKECKSPTQSNRSFFDFILCRSCGRNI